MVRKNSQRLPVPLHNKKTLNNTTSLEGYLFFFALPLEGYLR